MRCPRALLRGLSLSLSLLMGVACGSSSSSSSSGGGAPAPVANTISVSINGGPVTTENVFNVLYTSVTLCEPGTTTCQTINGILVDTGSSGLRILSSALTLSLPRATTANEPLAECLQFSNSSTWGSVRTADLQLAGEVAHSIALQVIGDPAVGTVPKACTNGGFPGNNDQESLGANGILGVGNFLQDCGPACSATGPSNPGLYYSCPTVTTCAVTGVPVGEQIANPVGSFASDNNGVVITLPPVTGEAPTLTGSLIFGIGTQSDNALGSAKVFTFDDNGFFGTTFNGKSLPFSFVDSGSTGLAFPDSGLATCSDFMNDLFCPKQTASLQATMTAPNGASETIPFTVGNADTLFAQFPGDSAFASVCSPALVTQANSPNGPNSFDWGLTFFFGRTVFTALEGQSTPGGTGPYVAF
jgi:hypothetical protein